MKTLHTQQSVTIPKDVKVDIKSRTVNVKGPRGVLTRNFGHLQIDIRVIGRRVVVEVWFGSKADVATVRTVCTHIKNMIVGVTKGYHYIMRMVYAHFPINCAIVNEGSGLEIRNFLGQKIVRRVELLEGVKITRSETVKDQLELQGNDLEKVGQSCALIHQSCTVKQKDIRKFLDGIYVSHKGKIGDFTD
eukprot:TRINITY_DN275_c0_g1_i1.p1 TRINITY_DN275_c0_g1~~TRINITY_DN275_c0_g1_i1.p1  ORF type:complete len:190 (+),score=26.51 TRINITY_DN275_c0_g1_i1:63-632(+)